MPRPIRVNDINAILHRYGNLRRGQQSTRGVIKEVGMAVVYKCDNCGKEAKHGDEWMNVVVNKRSIRYATYHGPEDGELMEPGFNRTDTLACSGSCAVRLILKKARDIEEWASSFVNYDEAEESDTYTKTYG